MSEQKPIALTLRECTEQIEALIRKDERARWLDQFEGAEDYADSSKELAWRYQSVVDAMRKETP